MKHESYAVPLLRWVLNFLKRLLRPVSHPGSLYVNYSRKTKTGRLRARMGPAERQKGLGPDLAIYRAEGLSDSAKKVYVYLSASADHDGYCFPFYRTIARRTGLSKSTVGKAIKELEAFGLLTHQQRISRRGGSSNLYHVKRLSEIFPQATQEERQTAGDQ